MRYETKDDLNNEELVRQYLEKTTQWDLVKLTRGSNENKYLFDWAVTDCNSKIVKFAEFKARKTTKHDAFPEGIVISLQKYNKGVEYYNSNNIDFCFIFWFEDGLFVYSYDPDHKLPVIRFLKDKKTRSGDIVSKWIFQPDQEKNYSDFELLEKAMNIMVKEDWKLKRNEQEITIEEFINAVWEERF